MKYNLTAKPGSHEFVQGDVQGEAQTCFSYLRLELGILHFKVLPWNVCCIFSLDRNGAGILLLKLEDNFMLIHPCCDHILDLLTTCAF